MLIPRLCLSYKYQAVLDDCCLYALHDVSTFGDASNFGLTLLDVVNGLHYVSFVLYATNPVEAPFQDEEAIIAHRSETVRFCSSRCTRTTACTASQMF